MKPLNLHSVKQQWVQPMGIAPLVVFRMVFFGLVSLGAIRFLLSGWIEELYPSDAFYFKFYGLGWVPDIHADQMYMLFVVCAIAALGAAFGLFYKLNAAVTFGAFFLYETTDATHYLNHYYLVLLLAFLMIFLPANRAFALDVKWRKQTAVQTVPGYVIQILRVQLVCVYFFAGLAKLNADWLVNHMPLAVWLPSKADLPIIGNWLALPLAAKLFSYGGALYDLSIGFLLWNKKTRPFAYLAVLVFHTMVGLLFNIGLFPWIMILCTLIFFSPSWHESKLKKVGYTPVGHHWSPRLPRLTQWAVVGFIAIQLVLPLRHMVYPGNLLWHEQGYRFGWRVMLVEKSGQAVFTVYNQQGVLLGEVDNQAYLSPYQEKQMAIQPDLILQYVHFLKDTLASQYQLGDLQIKCNSQVALNGRSAQALIDDSVDLTQEEEGWSNKSWVLPLKETSHD